MENRLRVRVRGVASFAIAAAISSAALASMAYAKPPGPTAASGADGVQAPPVRPGGQGQAVDPAHAAATVQSLCSKCHDLGLVASAKYDRAGWEEVLQRMYGHGLVASDEEAKEVLDYLSSPPPPSQ